MGTGLFFYKYRPRNGENLLGMQERVIPLLNELKTGMYGSDILISGHECINKIIIFTLLNIPWKEWRSYKQGNTAVNLLEIQSNGNVVVDILNCTQHLSKEKVC